MASTPAILFTSVDTTTRLSRRDEVESPSISSTNALARYEYEAGRTNANEGTKILMVEWEDDDTSRRTKGEWHVSWDGSTRVLPANDQQASDVHRMYFLLPPGVAVPTKVTLTLRPQDTSKASVVWHTNPLPALFPTELGASAGRKGVLHTIWAKQRLRVLQKETEAESQSNVEGIGLTMVIQEKEWIEQTFGVTAKPSGLNTLTVQTSVSQLPNSPATPRSPGGGRLMDKLAGLRLGTSEKDLAPSSSNTSFSNPLSPETSDIAVSSFAVFKGANPSQLAAKSPQPPQKSAPLKSIALVPPPEFIAQQQSSGGIMGSLNALSNSTPSPPAAPAETAVATNDDEDADDGLFAMPISPRSPHGNLPFSNSSGTKG